MDATIQNKIFKHMQFHPLKLVFENINCICFVIEEKYVATSQNESICDHHLSFKKSDMDTRLKVQNIAK